ncbi:MULTISPECIES: hypothetical protein [Streptomyces]|uniref:HAD family hydrolase n=1 Tax=Streptomyces TaxID=1883 RepID=UPI002E16BE90
MLGILSNSFIGAREVALFHVDELADQIVYSHEIGIGKPDVRAFEQHAPAGTCVHYLFIDYVAVTVEAAQAAGMQAHLFEDNVRTITRIAAHERAVPALSEVPLLGSALTDAL